MKKLLLFILCSVLFVSACSKTEPILVDEVTPAEPEETAELSDFTRETTIVTSDNQLEDDTGIGFAYNPQNVLDLDWSTAWCPDPEDRRPLLELSFPGKVKIDRMGIVPGFARDEKIYLENSRLKGISVSYDNEFVGRFDLEDEYGMHFIDLPEGEASSIQIEFTGTYQGSKYADTCISELDFWSDFVDAQDPEEAYTNYVDNFLDSALRPSKATGVEISIDGFLNSCGQVNESQIERQSHGWVSYLNPEGEHAYGYDSIEDHFIFSPFPDLTASFQVADVDEEDEVSIRWIKTTPPMPMENFQVHIVEESGELKTCSAGNTFVQSTISFAERQAFEDLGDYRVDLMINGKVKASTTVGVYQ